METQYHQFGSSESDFREAERKVATQTVSAGMKKTVVYILYGILVLLLLILLMVTGIKFTQLNKEIVNIKHHVQKISHGGATSSSSSETARQTVIVDQIEPVKGACRDGWGSFQSSCYLLSTTAVTWSRAEELCKAQGGHLLVLNNVDELDYISKIVEIRSNYWIGLVERHNEGHWSWVDGTDFSSTPTFWDEGQPDDWDYRENGEDCGQLHGSEIRKRKLWNDADCSLRYKYICEARA
ncbi:unnamed protein product [Ophioblennius macclurei]